MYKHVQSFNKTTDLKSYYNHQYIETSHTLKQLLDSPVQYTQHIGGTRHFNYPTEPILDILVGVNNLHDITSLDEKRLNYAGFYRLHHTYHKKIMMAQFNNLIDLKQTIRLHIVQMNHSIFNQYRIVDDLLSTNQNLIQLFSEKNNSSQKMIALSEFMKKKSSIYLINFIKII